MAKEETFKELEAAIRELKQAEARIEIIKLRLQYGESSHNGSQTTRQNTEEKPRKKTAVDLFLMAHSDLDPEDIEFVRLGEASTKQVANYLTKNGICETTSATVSRHIGPRYAPGPSDTKWKRMVDTCSVLRYHFYRLEPSHSS